MDDSFCKGIDAPMHVEFDEDFETKDLNDGGDEWFYPKENVLPDDAQLKPPKRSKSLTPTPIKHRYPLRPQASKNYAGQDSGVKKTRSHSKSKVKPQNTASISAEDQHQNTAPSPRSTDAVQTIDWDAIEAASPEQQNDVRETANDSVNEHEHADVPLRRRRGIQLASAATHPPVTDEFSPVSQQDAPSSLQSQTDEACSELRSVRKQRKEKYGGAFHRSRSRGAPTEEKATRAAESRVPEPQPLHQAVIGRPRPAMPAADARPSRPRNRRRTSRERAAHMAEELKAKQEQKRIQEQHLNKLRSGPAKAPRDLDKRGIRNRKQSTDSECSSVRTVTSKLRVTHISGDIYERSVHQRKEKEEWKEKTAADIENQKREQEQKLIRKHDQVIKRSRSTGPRPPATPGKGVYEREMEKKKEVQRKIEQMRAEKQQRTTFHAKPVPEHVMRPRPLSRNTGAASSMSCTQPEPFNLSTDMRHAIHKRRLNEKIQQEAEEERRRKEFRAQPVSLARRFFPHIQHKEPTEAISPDFQLRQREQHWREDEAHRAQVHAERRGVEAERRAEQERERKRLLAEERRRTQFKATPAPSQQRRPRTERE